MTPLTRRVTIGADPEFFVVNQKGRVLSAIGLLGGTKDSPAKVEYGAVQEDNVLAELNIDPASTEEEFVHNICAVRTTLNLLLPDGMYTKVITSHEYQELELKSFGQQALEFGCDPDYNAYTMSPNPAPSARSNLRTAGGHIHVGYTNPDPFSSCDLVMAMDLLLGIPSVLMDPDTRRRSMYGRAGALRYKEYGVEYRTLSNFWLEHEKLISWAYRNAVRAVNECDDLVCVEECTTGGVSWDEIQDTINNSDRENARRIVELCDLEVI